MRNRSFNLQCFRDANSSSPVRVLGQINRRSNNIRIQYELSGDLSEIIISELSEPRERKDRLWEQTCFEVFLAPQGSPSYWEFNISPSGHWNVYRFEAYREGMREELAFTNLPFAVHKENGSIMLSAELCLNGIIEPNIKLEAAISAVILYKNGKRTYWALIHSAEQADFHRRDSFIVEL